MTHVDLKEEQRKEEQRLFVRKKKPVISRAPLKTAAKMLVPYMGMGISALEFVSLPQVHPLPVQYHAETWLPTLAVAAIIYTAVYLVALFVRPVREKVAGFSWLICAFFLFFTLQDYLTLRTGILKLPFIPSPDKIVHELIANIDVIAADAVSSMTTLFSGLAVGIALGIVSGVTCGCVRLADYWINPLLKIIGPGSRAYLDAHLLRDVPFQRCRRPRRSRARVVVPAHAHDIERHQEHGSQPHRARGNARRL